jgi:hypothetical protein
MASRRVWAISVVLFGLGSATSAFADQPRDWMLAAGRPGTFVNIDVAFGALQAAIERRINIFGGANTLTLRASALAAIPFGSTQLDADVRVVILNLGVSVGAQDIWINQTFGPSDTMNRKLRREREASGDFDAQQIGFFEARAGLVLPFNDYVLFNNVNSVRLLSADDRTFDYQTGVVHDGDYFRSDFQLFFKHREWGALAPMLQVLNFPVSGQRETQLNLGFAYVSRAGLVRRDDLLLLQVLVHPGDTFGGYDNSDIYGLAMLRGPIMFTLAYRSVISL